jgi:hypothetical protein
MFCHVTEWADPIGQAGTSAAVMLAEIRTNKLPGDKRDRQLYR